MTIKIIILTHNSERTLLPVILSALKISPNIFIIDDYSEDNTILLAKEYNCKILKHKFENYSKQRNWAQKQIKAKKNDWILHLDSDEIITNKLAENIKKEIKTNKYNSYLIQKKLYFLKKPILFGSINPSWHLRLYKKGYGFCEDRLYDQHFISISEPGKLDGFLLDPQGNSITEWKIKHKKWAKLEAEEIFNNKKYTINNKNNNKDEKTKINKFQNKTLQGNLNSNIRNKKRWFKNNIYYKMPLFIRCFILFIYSYIFCLGFLDGINGLKFHYLHSFWFRIQVDKEILKLNKKNG